MSVVKYFVGQFSSKGHGAWYENSEEGRQTYPFTICICGHPSSDHLNTPHGWECLIGKCGCNDLLIVVAVNDVSPFRRFVNRIFGHRSPLGKGLKELTEKGGAFIQIVDTPCAVCGKDSEHLDVMSLQVGQQFAVGRSLRGTNVWFVCGTCAKNSNYRY